MSSKPLEIARSSPLLHRNRALADQKSVTSNVAWFKLAEFIRRGEKERAFALYRLLTHSLSDQPFLKKLEADIWLAFDEQEGQERYNNAAHCYLQEGRHNEALMIFEYLANRYSKNKTYLEKVIQGCEQLGWHYKRTIFEKKLFEILLEKGAIGKAYELFQTLQSSLKDAELFSFHRIFFVAALKNHHAEQEHMKVSLHKALEGLLRTGAQQEMQQFLATLESLNSVWHKDAVAYLRKHE